MHPAVQTRSSSFVYPDVVIENVALATDVKSTDFRFSSEYIPWIDTEYAHTQLGSTNVYIRFSSSMEKN